MFKGPEAKARVEGGERVRRVSWPEDDYVSFSPYTGNIITNDGTVVQDYVFTESGFWETYEIPDGNPLTNPAHTPKEPDYSEKDFWMKPTKPIDNCTCGSQYTNEGTHSRWCKTEEHSEFMRQLAKELETF